MMGNGNGAFVNNSTNASGNAGVSILANEQVLALKQGQQKADSNNKLSNSHTLDSLNELQVNKTGTPSMVSRYVFRIYLLCFHNIYCFRYYR